MATQFPVETDQPRIQVSLPVGRHTLELVVEDSAGLMSAPDTVTITVVREVARPSISGIQPTGALGGAAVDAVIAGENLTGASEVRFGGTGITAGILSGGTARQLPVRLTIDSSAPLGARSFTVTTPGGVAESPAGVVFTVTRIIPTIEPTITPTIVPTIVPTIIPTIRPTLEPTILPTIIPTLEPTIRPTIMPTILPTIEPTIIPTIRPTLEPTILPTVGPTIVPTILPTIEPTIRPTLGPIIDVTPTVSPDIPIIIPREAAERPVTDVRGIGPAFSKRLDKKGITSLAKLASMEPSRLAKVLDVSEVRAMTFIDEARRLLRG